MMSYCRQMLIEKTESDDELIDALRQEVLSWKAQSVRLAEDLEREEQTSRSRIQYAKTPDTGMVGASSSDVELTRLRRLCTQQV
jgi:hypothetical protein